ncbi:hypothetical protein [Salipaludibacillus aurantiacus]|nr:hypothetical protein [Salipaludibacillus aurantiacus]
MTVPFFTYAITIQKKQKPKPNKHQRHQHTSEEEWFLQKMTYLSRF